MDQGTFLIYIIRAMTVWQTILKPHIHTYDWQSLLTLWYTVTNNTSDFEARGVWGGGTAWS